MYSETNQINPKELAENLPEKQIKVEEKKNENLETESSLKKLLGEFLQVAREALGIERQKTYAEIVAESESLGVDDEDPEIQVLTEEFAELEREKGESLHELQRN